MRRRRLLGAAGASMAALAGCAGLPFGEAPEIDESSLEQFDFSSPAVEDGTLPAEYTCDGSGASPPLAVGTPPERADSLAIVVDRTDSQAAPAAHWLIWDIPADTREIPAGVPREPTVDSLGATQGLSKAATVGYLRPCPAEGRSGTYRFTCYAVLGDELGAPARAKRKEVLSHVADSVVGVGSFSVSYGR